MFIEQEDGFKVIFEEDFTQDFQEEDHQTTFTSTMLATREIYLKKEASWTKQLIEDLLEKLY